ncbi:MAG: HPr family phosphocarrier protein [Lachnospiraceae bacterium]|nr:HPr family phosphocarrier protein [Lachnospiraceae bacterium]
MSEEVTVFTLLNDIKVIKEFVSKVSFCKGNVDIKSADEHYTVDGKSIMGIFSLDLSKPVCVYFHNKEDYDDMFDFMNSNFPAIAVNR